MHCKASFFTILTSLVAMNAASPVPRPASEPMLSSEAISSTINDNVMIARTNDIAAVLHSKVWPRTDSNDRNSEEDKAATVQAIEIQKRTTGEQANSEVDEVASTEAIEIQRRATDASTDTDEDEAAAVEAIEIE